jgi:hypothetical protein
MFAPPGRLSGTTGFARGAPLSSRIFGHSMAGVVKILPLFHFQLKHKPLNLLELLMTRLLALELLSNHWVDLVRQKI